MHRMGGKHPMALDQILHLKPYLQNLCQDHIHQLARTSPLLPTDLYSVVASPKSEQRILEKLERELKGNEAKLTDLFRGSIVFHSVTGGHLNAQDKLRIFDDWMMSHQGHLVLSRKDHLDKPYESGFRNIKYVLELYKGASGYVPFELQLVEDHIFQNSKCDDHHIYESIRTSEDPGYCQRLRAVQRQTYAASDLKA